MRGSISHDVIQRPILLSKLLGGRNLMMVWGRVTVSGYSYRMSVRTMLPDHTKQIEFQKRPSNVSTPVPSILNTELKQSRDSQYLDG
jgi:hypothetical protein